MLAARGGTSGTAGRPGTGPTTDLATFAKAQHARIGEYLRCNWSGIPDELPRVLVALLDELERDARAQGVAADRAALKAMLAASLRAHHVGTGAAASEALRRVA